MCIACLTVRRFPNQMQRSRPQTTLSVCIYCLCHGEGEPTWVVCTMSSSLVDDVCEHSALERLIYTHIPYSSAPFASTLSSTIEAHTHSNPPFTLFGTMRALFHLLILFARLGAGVSSVPSESDIAFRAGDPADDLDEWLAAAKRVSPEALKACPSTCSTASTGDRKLDSPHARGLADFNQWPRELSGFCFLMLQS
jgi:hypothetical protein